MIVLKIIGIILLAILLIIVFVVLTLAPRLYVLCNCRKCKHCKHYMEYKGLKEDNNNGHYLFYCPNCGAWEQIPKEDFYYNMDRDFKYNEPTP